MREGAVFIELEGFRERVVDAYNGGAGDDLPADIGLARSLVPPGTAALRDFSHLAPEIPRFDPQKCVGCMECVAACPDTAIVARVVEGPALEHELADEPDARGLRSRFAITAKYHTLPERNGEAGGLFGLFVDPTKCKGCGECVEVCGVHDALAMERKTPEILERNRRAFSLYRRLPPTPERFISARSLADVLLADRSLLYAGGAGSCVGCGEATAIRMMLAATGYTYGEKSLGIVAATGCNTVYSSTYPYNPFLVSWTNSLFENAPADAMGIRLRWDQQGRQDRKLWVIGGDGAMLDIGFGSLSRMLLSGLDIKVLILDTQVYSNTGGQASTASYRSQDAKMATFGTVGRGKRERRKELGAIVMMHPDVFVAQTITADPNHFLRSVMRANEFPGPAVVNVYATCQPEHGVGDDRSAHQARLARDTRTFPVFVYDPGRGETIRDRLSLQGNPSLRRDWHLDPKTGRALDFLTFAATEARFARHFGAEGEADEALLAGRDDRLRYWRLLQELAGLR